MTVEARPYKVIHSRVILEECDEFWQVEKHYTLDGRVLKVKYPFELITQKGIEVDIISSRKMTENEKDTFIRNRIL
ncbi:hypothetical protein H6G33_10295 [Calothrix sp. FACHB-1219]|uniref:hypothetical protein n=1 Tax=unclassified Calothrix TaxID=2619626 RepID=UPI001684DFAF|nr:MULTISPECIES: hypothetical protein [unclassified Calothrix]MBD2201736.1 hypothetical protein [Calothrix sp. FACHB-168]MBD2217422.1 hypothetical protein [Calothrix sp. FACHB-1219]